MRRLKLSIIKETKKGALIETQGQRQIVSKDSILFKIIKAFDELKKREPKSQHEVSGSENAGH